MLACLSKETLNVALLQTPMLRAVTFVDFAVAAAPKFVVPGELESNAHQNLSCSSTWLLLHLHLENWE